MSIDPRLIERRKTVAESNAKRNLSRLLKFLTGVVFVGSLVWLVLSPWMSVSQVDTRGIEVSTAHSILADQGVVAGTPMIQIRASATEQALLQDPWIAQAHVEKHWPDRVTVTVVERSPVAWTRTESGWTRRAVDGVALPSGSEPDPEMAHVDMAELADVAAETAPDLVGALEFIAALPRALHPGTVVRTHQGELWATVSGYQVRLGRAVEMREKALSLAALLAEPIPEGSILILIAPTNPAVMTPGADDTPAEVDEETTGETESSDDDRDD